MSAVLVDLEQLAELVAERVVQLLVEREQAPASGLVDAATLARVLGVSRSTVYQHAQRLGAVEVGDGDRPRLRFDVDRACAAWTPRVETKKSQQPEAPVLAGVRRCRRRAKSGSSGYLLPVRGARQR